MAGTLSKMRAIDPSRYIVYVGFVLTAGEIDLSIGPIVAVSALVSALVLRENFWFLGACLLYTSPSPRD